MVGYYPLTAGAETKESKHTTRKELETDTTGEAFTDSGSEGKERFNAGTIGNSRSKECRVFCYFLGFLILFLVCLFVQG